MGHTTNINVNIKSGDSGTVSIYNILGQNVKTFNVKEGSHKLNWNGKGCASGIYFVKLSTSTVNSTKKLVIVN
jgi:flagellar hook assembly protein FlgD